MAFNSCTFSGNSNFGLRLKDFDEASVTGCSFAGNDKPVRLRANLVSALVANNTFSGNTFKGVVIGDGTGNSAITSGTHTWSASPEMYVYRCSTDVSVEGSSKDAGGETDALGAGTDGNARPGAAGNSGFGQAGGSKPAARDVTPTLVLSPGAVVQLRENKLLKIDHAVLTARGQPGTPVTFDNYVSGEFWNSVRLDHADGSELEYCTFDSGGYDGAGLPAVEGAVYCFYTDALIRRCTFTNACRRDTSVGLQVKYCAPTIRQCRFDNCGRGVGINDADGCLHVDSCEFEQCREGIYVEKDAPSRSSRCNFIDNTYAGVNNTSDADSVGRANYSTRDRRLIDSIFGLEYDAGCWIGRLVVERLSTGRSEATTRLLLQLELVGLSRIGSSPLHVLKDNIPGYQLLRDERITNSPFTPYD